MMICTFIGSVVHVAQFQILMHTYMYMYMYCICICTCTNMYVYMYMYMYMFSIPPTYMYMIKSETYSIQSKATQHHHLRPAQIKTCI